MIHTVKDFGIVNKSEIDVFLELSCFFDDIEWFALETNRDHSVIFEIASKYCISDSFDDYDGYSISSNQNIMIEIFT